MANKVELVVEEKRRGNGVKSAADDLERLNRQAKGSGDGLDDISRRSASADIALGTLATGGVFFLADQLTNLVSLTAEWGQASVGMASDLREVDSLLGTVLGSSLEDYENRINGISEATGRSSDAIKLNSNLLLGLIGNQGFAQDQVSSLGASFAEAALDLESFTNQAGGLEAISQGIRGETEGLARFGVDARQAALEATALEQGLIKAGETMDKQTRTLAILAQIQKDQALAMGDATRTADGYANKQRALNDQLDDFQRLVGEELLNSAKPAQDLLAEMASVTLPQLEQAVKNVAQGFAETTSQEGFGDGLVSFSENLGRGLAVVTRSYESDLRSISNQNIQTAESTDDLINEYQRLFDIRRQVLLLDQGGINFSRDQSRQIIDELALMTQSGEEFRDVITQLSDISRSGLGGQIFFNPFSDDLLPSQIEEYREAIILASAANRDFASTTLELENAQKGAGGELFPVEQVRSYVTELQNPLDILAQINETASSAFSDIDFAETDFNGYFAPLQEGADTSSERVELLVASLGRVRDQLTNISGIDIISANADLDKSAVDFALQTEGVRNSSVDTQASLLESSGISADEIVKRTIQAQNKKLADDFSTALAEFESAGVGTEALVSLFESTSQNITDVGTDIEAVEELADGFRAKVLEFTTELETLGQAEYTPTISFNFPDYELLVDIEQRIGNIVGTDLANLSNSIRTPDTTQSIGQTANLRQ